MNVMLQRHCARYIYVVPDGLKELMSDISREVIRSQPENIYTFVADYLDALLITRENARVAARLVQSITDIATTTAEFLLKTGMNRREADKVVSIIQKAFRKYIRPGVTDAALKESEVEEINVVSDVIHQADISEELAEDAAKIIQNAYRRFKIRRDQERELLSGMVDWRVAARSAIRLYRKTGVTHEEANRAATLIKAAYKGYYTRHIMKKLAEDSRMHDEEMMEEEEYDEEVLSEHKYMMTPILTIQIQSKSKFSNLIIEGFVAKKIVTINYGSTIPHVDFAEPKKVEPAKALATESPEPTDKDTTESTSKETSASTVVFSAIEGIFDMALKEIQTKELQQHDANEQEKTAEPEIIQESKGDKPITEKKKDDITDIPAQEIVTAEESQPVAQLDEQVPTEAVVHSGEPVAEGEVIEETQNQNEIIEETGAEGEVEQVEAAEQETNIGDDVESKESPKTEESVENPDK
ncbi:hypothetical protein NQ315_012097 [Exocentrus adspersus]|uniref:RIIa domain-containing protein n=1 Tax=Exocentrus adspersus TaxID=1586481 RepID=A0AAV8VXL7_9CUCU|nr:hypothetical protein NQ315_012097 [Exocentrus adspersus]